MLSPKKKTKEKKEKKEKFPPLIYPYLIKKENK